MHTDSPAFHGVLEVDFGDLLKVGVFLPRVSMSPRSWKWHIVMIVSCG